MTDCVKYLKILRQFPRLGCSIELATGKRKLLKNGSGYCVFELALLLVRFSVYRVFAHQRRNIVTNKLSLVAVFFG